MVRQAINSNKETREDNKQCGSIAFHIFLKRKRSTILAFAVVLAYEVVVNATPSV